MSKVKDEQPFTFRLPKKIHHKFRVKTVKEKTSMTEVLNNFAERYVEKKLNLE